MIGPPLIGVHGRGGRRFHQGRTFAWEQKLVKRRYDNQAEICGVRDQHAHQLSLHQCGRALGWGES